MKQLLKQIDFALLAAWVLLHPAKESKAYFLGFALLAAVYLLRAFLVERHFPTSAFSRNLGLAILLLAASVLTTPGRQNALLFLCDLILVTLIIVFFDNGRRDRDQALVIMAGLITLTSLVSLGLRLSGAPLHPGLFFDNPILQGVLSGLGVLLLLSRLKERFTLLLLLILIVNLAGVFASASKAAFIGTAVFALFSVIRQRSWLPLVFGLVILAFLVPNPVKQMFRHSLHHDPYAFDRLRIWDMSLRVGHAYFPWGTGLGNFAAAAPAFNFPQENGPARYFKVPRKTHNDFLKLYAESGIFGLAVLLILAAAVARRLRASGFSQPGGPVVLYLFFQALLFNLLFLLPFLLIFLFLLDDWIDPPRTYLSPAPASRLVLSVFVLILAGFGYILPFLSDRCLLAARNQADFLKAFGRAQTAARLTPLAPEPHLLLADLYARFDKTTPHPRALANARRHLALARRLNPYSAEIPVSEALLLERSLARDRKYPGLEKEVLDCLDRARQAAPLNPFIRLHRARVLFEFDHDAAAGKAARKALELEPRFLEARVFLQRRFPRPGSETEFKRDVAAILALQRRLRPRPGSYLYELFSLPPAERGWLRGTFPDLSLPAATQDPGQSGKIR